MNFLFKIFKKESRPIEGGILFQKLTVLLQFSPSNITYYEKAFTHRSANKIDEKGHQISYERLEFLGDAVLGTVTASHLFHASPKGDEGYLTKMRSKIVSRENLNTLGKELKLIDLLQSKIQKNQFGENIYGNILEALIGAIYLDKGFFFCEEFIKKNILIKLEDIEKLEGKITSYKSLFIEYCQKQKKTFKFDSYEDVGCENTKYFAVRLYFNESIIARARATSKKKAEEKAAQRAYFALQENFKPKY